VIGIDDEDDGIGGDLDEADLRDELTQKMRTEGAMVAYQTALKICRDPKATAAAKASAVNSLFRAGGFFANQEPGDREKHLSEMPPDELQSMLRKATASLKKREDEIKKPSGGLFD
jgi:hypothetical protein